MRLLMLFGPQAVGKMTVGQELEKITPLRLFHNHMTIEPVLRIFGEFRSSTILKMRELIFEEFLQTDRYGLIFTFQWCFDVEDDWKYAQHVAGMFRASGAEVDWVELTAPLDVRLERNGTENRLKEKPSKRNLEMSEFFLRHAEEKYRDTSLPGEITFPNYLRIDNSDRSAAEVAKMIAEHFGYPQK